MDVAETGDAAGRATRIAIFVGLGGIGSRIVDRLAGRLSQSGALANRMEPARFIAIDDVAADLANLRHVPQQDRYLLAPFDQFDLLEKYRQSGGKIPEWLDERYLPRRGVKSGAGFSRMGGRLCFHFHSPAIRQRLADAGNELLRKASETGAESAIDVFLFSSLAGGTGSGILFPVAYLLQEIARDSGWPHPRIVAHLVLSTMLTGLAPLDLQQYLHANTYAGLKELEHLNRIDYPEVRQVAGNVSRFDFRSDEQRRELKVDAAPFLTSFLYDRSQKRDPADEIGDAFFLQMQTGMMDRITSTLESTENQFQRLTVLPGDFPGAGAGFTRNYAAAGAVALILPEEFVEYCALRFAVDAFAHNLTIGVIGQEPWEDTLELRRLAVKWPDPAYRPSGESEQARRMNGAFIDCVREMARREQGAGLTSGSWMEVVELIEYGPVMGTDEGGRVVRGESAFDRIAFHLDVDRLRLLEPLQIRERAFAFEREEIAAYGDILACLREDIRAAEDLVGKGVEQLRDRIRQGSAMDGWGLDPLAERYLLLRIVERCDQEWIPKACSKLEKIREKHVSNVNLDYELTTEIPDRLAKAAEAGILGRMGWRKDKDFQEARNEAQKLYSEAVKAARELPAAAVKLTQLRTLRDWAATRSAEYLQLARISARVMRELSEQAEHLRQRHAGPPPLSNCVEVLEAVDGSRERMWGEAYQIIFRDENREKSIFDRRAVGAAMAGVLNPQAGNDGVPVKSKTTEQTAQELREALLAAGRDVARRRIDGEQGEGGLDLQTGLELEARIVFKIADTSPLDGQRLAAHLNIKFAALAQRAGVMAYMDRGTPTSTDGSLVHRTRYLFHGFGARAERRKFVDKLQGAVAAEGRQVVVDDRLDDRRTAVVVDLEIPLPVYRIESVTSQLEAAYLELRAGNTQAANLHIDCNWEHSLRDLNPRSATDELAWALRMLARSLVAGLVNRSEDGGWTVREGDRSQRQAPARNLEAVVLQFCERYRSRDARAALENAVERASGKILPGELQARRARWREDARRNEPGAGVEGESPRTWSALRRFFDEEPAPTGPPVKPPLPAEAPRTVTISVHQANVLEYSADVMILKYAQSLHGVDKAAANALSSEGDGLLEKLPHPGESLLVPGAPAVGAQEVLFAGVAPLKEFGYLQIRDFVKHAIGTLAGSRPMTEHIAITLHGAEFGLDETEAFEAEVAGILDCLRSGSYPPGLARISIVEINAERFERLEKMLTELLGSAVLDIGTGGRLLAGGPVAAAERMRSAGHESEHKPLVFVAMPFDPAMLDHYEYGIRQTAQRCGYLCERADQAHFTGDILDFVKDRIRRSCVVIADLTSANPNVYLEVGYAWGSGKPTILLARDGEDLKFNTQGQRCIRYSRIKDIENELAEELQHFRTPEPTSTESLPPIKTRGQSGSAVSG